MNKPPPMRVCAYRKCDNSIPKNAHHNKRYCKPKHSQAERNAKRYEKGDHNIPEHYDDEGRPNVNEDRYLEYTDNWVNLVADNEMTYEEVAVKMDLSASSVGRLHRAWLFEKKQPDDQGRYDWDPPEPYSDDLVEDFIIFREKMFTTPVGEPYYTPLFQRRWVEALISTWKDGGQQVILSPPRHGKTELLTHFCIWLIIRRPNIRIIYVGGNSEIAEQSVQSVRDHLEDNENLQQFHPPNEPFKPRAKGGRTWTGSKFKVGTRTIIGIKSPTMVAIGRGGKLPSRDADIIVVDDPEDHDSTIHPATREDTRGWWAKSVMSRKEEHVPVFVIGSRVHPDDLLGHLLSSDGWDNIIEQVHDDGGCNLDPEELDAHWDCMLWPEFRSYRWAYGKKTDPLEGEFYEMVYQNVAVDDEMAVFKVEDIDACMDQHRILGHVPEGTVLVAGLDPAHTGYQAAFLWAYDPETQRRFMVDLDNRLGGGIGAAFDVMQRWYQEYQCGLWVVEENLYHGAITHDRDITKWAGQNYVKIEGHQTYKNKWDKNFGVTAMARYFRHEDEQRRRYVSLPTGDEDGRLKSLMYKKQLINFSRDSQTGRRRRRKADIVMASWFPEKMIRRMSYEMRQGTKWEYEMERTLYPFQPMSALYTPKGEPQSNEEVISEAEKRAKKSRRQHQMARR